MLGFDRITFDSHVMGGRACLRGMRITVSLVVNLVANGMTTAEILEAYPYLEPEDVRQALQCDDLDSTVSTTCTASRVQHVRHARVTVAARWFPHHAAVLCRCSPQPAGRSLNICALTSGRNNPLSYLKRKDFFSFVTSSMSALQTPLLYREGRLATRRPYTGIDVNAGN
jgi:uncharacterized protein (DUF433 family)